LAIPSGGRMTEHDVSDGFKTYFVVTGVVINNGKMLILRKSDKDYNYPGHWSFCSGFVKEFEAGEDTVLREIKEETGLEVEIIRKGRMVVAKDNKRKKEWVVIPYLCKANKNEIRLDHENTEYKWITKEELKDYKFVPGLIDDVIAVGFL
jgi:8-oxo-dGTP diphosphatase